MKPTQTEALLAAVLETIVAGTTDAWVLGMGLIALDNLFAADAEQRNQVKQGES